MVTLGYSLSSEELGPTELVETARLAEEAGFEALTISDHYHPWVPSQGHSPFVWAVIGGIAAVTERISVMTAVTCPTMRIHPAIIAQAAATAATMLPRRFTLGLGSGEALNELVLGDAWPRSATRIRMLEEAIEIMRELWTGEEVEFEGEFYNVRAARLFTLPDAPIEVAVAATGPMSATLAGRNDGLVTMWPGRDLVETFEEAGGRGKPKHVGITVCWDPSPEAARELIRERWPTSPLSGRIHSDLPTPAHYEQVLELVPDEEKTSAVPHGNSPDAFIESFRECIEAGFTHVYVHQIGPRQAEFLRFWNEELRPEVERTAVPSGVA